MKSIYGGYEVSEFTWAYGFAGANTANGFRGLYDELADEGLLDRLYIIKGGAGTGKSTLIRRVSEAFAERGGNVEYYLCGSDPTSIDCAVLDGRIAILDGTAPHVCEMRYPGAASALIDLSVFWNSAYLEEHRADIVGLCAEKREIMESVYRYMRAADIAERERTVHAKRLFDTEKAERYAERLTKRLGKPCERERGRVSPRYERAVSMHGCRYLRTFERLAETVYTVTDVQDCAPLFMELLSARLTESGHDTLVSRLPITGQIDGIYVPEKSVTFVCREASDEGTGENDIRMTRFVKDGPRGELRLAARLYGSCVDEAVAQLERARKRHFALESIYGEAMDFPSLERYTEALATML